MTITITSTEKVVELNGIKARIWEGTTDSGTKVHCFVTRIACHKDSNLQQFQEELQQQVAPSAEISAYPLKMII